MREQLPPKAGYVAVIGRPNTGKSTLINQLAREKRVITSKRAQTTVFNTTCVLNFPERHMQLVLVDTPGINFEKKLTLKKAINKQALQALKALTLKIWVIEAFQWTEHDQQIAQLLDGHQEHTLVIINKIDKVLHKTDLLETMSRLADLGFKQVLPHQADNFEKSETLMNCLCDLLPEQEHFFSENDQVLVSQDFQVREIIREKCLRYLGQEIPYKLTFVCEQIKQEKSLTKIFARIDCSSLSHKKIIIGAQGQLLKQISTASRLSLEKILKRKVFLKLWVKVCSDKNNLQTFTSQLHLAQEDF